MNNEQKCVECEHDGTIMIDGRCAVVLTVCPDEDQGAARCGCKCSFSEAEQKVSAGEGVPESDLIKCPACNMTVARSLDASKEKALAFVKSVYALRDRDDGSLPFNTLDYIGMEDLIRELSQHQETK